MLRHAKSDLPNETEELIKRVIGCGIEVHRQLGPGYLETVYQRAFQMELAMNALPYVCEAPIVSITRALPFKANVWISSWMARCSSS